MNIHTALIFSVYVSISNIKSIQLCKLEKRKKFTYILLNFSDDTSVDDGIIRHFSDTKY